MDAYDALAAVYDDWQDRYGRFSDVVLAELEAVLEPLDDGRPRAFVDLGCGTGSLLVGLTQRLPQWRFTGVDGSEAMLEQARRKSAGGRIRWQHARLGDPLPGGPYDAAGSFFNTLNHLPDRRALEATFAAVQAAVIPGGLFVFDVNNELGFERWWRETRVYAGPGWRLRVDARYEAAERRAHAILSIERGEHSWDVTMCETLFPSAEIAEALPRAGFDVVSSRPWRPTPHDPPGATLWVAKRR